ncbi:lipopolysaccharide biosynthesis protein [Zobellia uliginosa]|uniref:lipopolysaccharide biosynthesis protein n=1 Tax=Zobellia uliginosa TaxID=143224 RepID=UPI001C077841|nr:oligosaccharide flippase family protein [Zobellia uliginosa]MBU2948247.1 oligosaccharide flippase family protein [Zobellia uliginosa]
MNNKSLFKNLSLFTFFNVLNSVIPFLLLPFLTVNLSPEEYGIVDIFYNITLIATPIIGLSIVQSIGRYYFEDVDLPKFITTVFVVLLRIGALIVLVFFLFSFLAYDFLLSYGFPPFLLTFALIYTFFSQIAEILLLLWRVSYNTVRFGVFKVMKTVIDLGLSIFLIAILEMGWEGRVIPQVLVAIVFGALAIYFLYRNGNIQKLQVDKGYKKSALAFSVPLVFHSLGSSLLSFSDRFFILFMLGLDNVGVYSVGYQIGMVIALLQNSFNQAWVPFFFKKLKENEYRVKLKIVKLSYFYFIFLFLVVLVFYFATPIIYRYFVGKDFESGSDIVLWVLLGYAFLGMYKMVVNYLFYLKKTKIIAYCTFFTVLINLVLNYVFIKLNGMVGAAQATLISFVILFIVVFVYSNKNFPMPWGLRKNN